MPTPAVRALTALLLAAPALHAQEPAPWPELREADIPAIIATLRTRTARQDAARATGEELRRRHEGLRDGSIDPLELFRQYVPGFRVPEGARYIAACSRALSALTPTVFFTFGPPAGDKDPARARQIFQRTVRFYEAAGFSYDERFKHFVADDESCTISFELTPVEGFTQQYPDCVDGPYLMAYFGPAANRRFASVGAAETPAAAPMDDRAFDLASVALISAWQDYRDSAELDAVRAELSRPAGPGEAEGRRIMARILDIRERNLAVFRRHAATLVPLVQRYTEAGR